MFILPMSRAASRAPLSRPLDDSFDRFFSNAVAAATARSPALDVSETGSAYLVSFDVPGVTREQLKVSVEGRRVSIETVDEPTPVQVDTTLETSADAPKTEAPRALYRERSTARYARTVSLPAEVDQGASQARFANGVLTLTLAKKVATGATLLTVA